MQKLIIENVDSRVCISQFAADNKISINRVTAAYRRLTGTSPYQHLIALRIERACELLGSGDESISDIALSLGFYDQSHFTRVFKKMMGDPPRSYRQKALVRHHAE